MTRERFLLRTEGGPEDGIVRVANSEGDPRTWTWPLPDVLPYDKTGDYYKISESGLDERPESMQLVRGAVYEWRPSADPS